MSNYRITKKALKDISEIWNYTRENWSENKADAYYNNLIYAFSEIAINPTLGKDYNNILPGLLGHRLNKHIIFYRITDPSSIEILRILHERMDLKKRIPNK